MQTIKSLSLLLLLNLLSFSPIAFAADQGVLGVILDGRSSKVYASSVLTDSAAAKGGVLKGDQIMMFAGKTVTSSKQLQSFCKKTTAGQKIPVTVMRKNKKLKLQIVMGSRKDFDNQSLKNLTGKAVPELEGINVISNKLTKLSSATKGKTTLIVLWATWCPSCKAAIPDLNKMQEENKNLVVFAVSTEPLNRIQKFQKKIKMSYVSVQADESTLNRSYWTEAIPTLILVNKKGIVEKVSVGTEDLDEIKQRIIKQK